MTTRRNWFAVLAALTFATFLAGAVQASAQDCSCIIVGGCKEVFFYPAGPTILVCPSSGSGTFNCNREPPPPNVPLNESLPPVKISATGFDPAYGNITTQVDPDRTSSNATIVSNQADAQFPATGRISFYARTRIDGLDGEYCSVTELVFVNKKLTSYRPFNNEEFCLESDVDFYPCGGDPTDVKFTLKAGSTCVTLN